MTRTFYITPVTSGLAAYCYSHTIEHPSAAIGFGVFFTACTLALIIRTIAAAESLSDYRRGYEDAKHEFEKTGKVEKEKPMPRVSLMW